MSITPREAAEAWSRADLLHSAAAVEAALDRMAAAISERLRSRTKDLGPPGHDSQFGWGLALAPDC